MSIVASSLLVSLLVGAQGLHDGECASALTLKGHSSKIFDLEFEHHSFWDGTPSYLGPENQRHPYNERVIQFGCDTPSDFSQGDRGGDCIAGDRDQARGNWVIVTSNSNANLTDTVELVAICTEGCPADGVWPRNGTLETTWELTGEFDLPSGTVTATAHCCEQWVPKCEKESCSKHTLFGGNYNPTCSLDRCCYWHGFNQFTAKGMCRSKSTCAAQRASVLV